MNIVFIAPGVGDTFYCQNCVRNLDLVKELQKQGHSPLIVPMYLPLSVDIPEGLETPLFFGAINVYLREKFSFFQNIPSWVKRCFESKRLLTWISKRSGSTDPDGLEEMTLSVMRGAGGKHEQELNRLVDWLKQEVKPDAVHLSNALLMGIGVKVKKDLNVPVFVTLQDEDQWIDKMKDPYDKQAWKLIKEGAESIDAFTPVSQYYADFVQKRTGISPGKMAVVPIGITFENYQERRPTRDPLTIGYLSRMTESLGLDILVDAFILLKNDDRFKALKLKIRGGMTPQDKRFIAEVNKKIFRNGYEKDVDIKGAFHFQDVRDFFDFLTLLSVPAPHGEAFGLFILESMASGIPVVQPNLGGYSEIIHETGGGIIYEPNTPEGLAEALSNILIDTDKIDQMSARGRNAVHEKYTIERMAHNLLSVYHKYLE